jgi:hypothetical protein
MRLINLDPIDQKYIKSSYIHMLLGQETFPDLVVECSFILTMSRVIQV